MEWAPVPPTHCRCDCHVGGASVFHVPPDVRDPVAAVTACTQCRNDHTVAIVSDWPPPPPPPNPLLLPPWNDDDATGSGTQ